MTSATFVSCRMMMATTQWMAMLGHFFDNGICPEWDRSKGKTAHQLFIDDKSNSLLDTQLLSSLAVAPIRLLTIMFVARGRTLLSLHGHWLIPQRVYALPIGGAQLAC